MSRYGTTTLAQIEERVTRLAREELGVEVVCAQTDYEGEMCQLVASPSPYVSSRQADGIPAPTPVSDPLLALPRRSNHEPGFVLASFPSPRSQNT